ncbi:hypothetical protein RFI_32789, partial [Reticulomyxa filosa]
EEEEDDSDDEYQRGKNIHDSLKKLDELITESSGAHMENINVAEVQEAFKDIEKSFKARPDLLNDLINTAVIPIMELLQSRNVEVVKCVARTITLLINDTKNGKKFLESLCLVQFVPALGEMVNSDNPDIANAASPFLTCLCDKRSTFAFSRKMFIASGGLNILASALKKKYAKENKPLIFCAVDCISMIFCSLSHNKQDLARLFTKAEILPALMARFCDTVNDDISDSTKAIEYGEKMAQIFLKVVEITDRVMKGKEMKHHGVLSTLLSTLPQLEKDLMTHGTRKHILIKILKGIVKLSRNAEGIQQLMDHRVIASVYPFLNSEDPDIQTCVIMVLFYMTLVPQQQAGTKSACEEAAVNGAIPRLKTFIQENHKAMYYLVLTICKFTKNATDFTLLELKKHDMAQFYLDMTKSKSVFTQMSGLTSLSEWMHYSSNVQLLEFVLCRSDNIIQLISVFGLPVEHRMRERLTRYYGHHQVGSIVDTAEILLDLKIVNRGKPEENKENEDDDSDSEASAKCLRTNRYAQYIPSLLIAFNEITRISKKIAKLLGGNNLFLATLGEWLLATTYSSLDMSQTKLLLLVIVDLFENLDGSIKKTFVQVMLPVIDTVFQTKMQKRSVINKMVETLTRLMWMDADDDTMAKLSDYTNSIIRRFQQEIAEREKERNSLKQ